MFFSKLVALANAHLNFVKKAFSDGDSPSSSRLLTVPHSLAAIFCAIYMTVKTNGHPDGMALTALGGFATVHYAVNRATNAWGKTTPEPVTPPIAAPPPMAVPPPMAPPQ